MSQSDASDKIVAQAESNRERNKKKDSTPPGNYSDKYVTGYEKYHAAGKGDKNRDIKGWHSDEVTEKLRKIYGKEKKAN
jgi:hypothetical protein